MTVLPSPAMRHVLVLPLFDAGKVPCQSETFLEYHVVLYPMNVRSLQELNQYPSASLE